MARMLLFIGLVFAETPFRLPGTEPVEVWQAPLRLAGFTAGPGDDPDGAWAAIEVSGTRWVLVVHDRAGVRREASVAIPSSARQREELVWLAQSLLDPGEPPFAAVGPAPTAPRAAPATPGASSAPPRRPTPRSPEGPASTPAAPEPTATAPEPTPAAPEPTASPSPEVPATASTPIPPPSDPLDPVDPLEPPAPARHPPPTLAPSLTMRALVRGGAPPAFGGDAGLTLAHRAFRAQLQLGLTSPSGIDLDPTVAEASAATAHSDLLLGAGTTLGPVALMALAGGALARVQFREEGEDAGAAWIPAAVARVGLGVAAGPLQIGVETTIGRDLRAVRVDVAGVAQDAWSTGWVSPSVSVAWLPPKKDRPE